MGLCSWAPIIFALKESRVVLLYSHELFMFPRWWELGSFRRRVLLKGSSVLRSLVGSIRGNISHQGDPSSSKGHAGSGRKLRSEILLHWETSTGQRAMASGCP